MINEYYSSLGYNKKRKKLIKHNSDIYNDFQPPNKEDEKHKSFFEELDDRVNKTREMNDEIKYVGMSINYNLELANWNKEKLLKMFKEETAEKSRSNIKNHTKTFKKLNINAHKVNVVHNFSARHSNLPESAGILKRINSITNQEMKMYLNNNKIKSNSKLPEINTARQQSIKQDIGDKKDENITKKSSLFLTHVKTGENIPDTQDSNRMSHIMNILQQKQLIQQQHQKLIISKNNSANISIESTQCEKENIKKHKNKNSSFFEPQPRQTTLVKSSSMPHITSVISKRNSAPNSPKLSKQSVMKAYYQCSNDILNSEILSEKIGKFVSEINKSFSKDNEKYKIKKCIKSNKLDYLDKELFLKDGHKLAKPLYLYNLNHGERKRLLVENKNNVITQGNYIANMGDEFAYKNRNLIFDHYGNNLRETFLNQGYVNKEDLKKIEKLKKRHEIHKKVKGIMKGIEEEHEKIQYRK
jgi:hypothetical protein